MGFFEKLLRGAASSHGGGHHGRDRTSHHGWGNSYPSNSAPPTHSTTGGPSCPKCGFATNPGGRYCAQCGTALVPGNCVDCNANLAPGTKFCPNCGKSQQS
ncbi:MAG: zinc ribbon domain-containing protein [Rhodocyclales bacterium GT-UBC]|nr:MAG: zinc ribbon domain-containing protein [Rhodocyclales bacterium GT-UBC]